MIKEERIFEEEGHYKVGEYPVPVWIKKGETAREAMKRERWERASDNRLEFDKLKEPFMKDIKYMFELENRKRVVTTWKEKKPKRTVDFYV